MGKSCQLRVIQSNYPPSVFTNRGFNPPSSFCPAQSLGLHGETASSRGVRLRHHYCQHVCWSWRQRLAWLRVTRCRLTVWNQWRGFAGRRETYSRNTSKQAKCSACLIFQIPLTHKYTHRHAPSWFNHTACVLNLHSLSRCILEHPYWSLVQLHSFTSCHNSFCLLWALTKCSSSCLMRAPYVSFSPAEWLCSSVFFSPPFSASSFCLVTAAASLWVAVVCSLACWPLSATADKIWHLVWNSKLSLSRVSQDCARALFFK